MASMRATTQSRTPQSCKKIQVEPERLQDQVDTLSCLLNEVLKANYHLRARDFVLEKELRESKALFQGHMALRVSTAVQEVRAARWRPDPKSVRSASQLSTSKRERKLAAELQEERRNRRTLQRHMARERRSYSQLISRHQDSIRALELRVESLEWKMDQQAEEYQKKIAMKNDLINFLRARKGAVQHPPSPREDGEKSFLAQMDCLATQFSNMSLKRTLSDGDKDEDEFHPCGNDRSRFQEPKERLKPYSKQFPPGKQPRTREEEQGNFSHLI